jgi:hypothetical protein
MSVQQETGRGPESFHRRLFLGASCVIAATTLIGSGTVPSIA